MNRFCGIGRLTKDPDVRYTQGDDSMCIARYTLAIDRRGKKGEADFINCVAFRKSGEFAEKYLSKGMKIGVDGHIQTGSYKHKDGYTVYTTDVVVDAHYFCESKGEDKSDRTTDGFMQIPEQEELPFK